MGVQGLEVFRVQGLGFERGLGFRVCFFVWFRVRRRSEGRCYRFDRVPNSAKVCYGDSWKSCMPCNELVTWFYEGRRDVGLTSLSAIITQQRVLVLTNTLHKPS